MKHDSITINEFKQVLSQFDGEKFTYNNDNYVIVNEKLFYDGVPYRTRCMWYSMGTHFSEGVKNELLRKFRNI